MKPDLTLQRPQPHRVTKAAADRKQPGEPGTELTPRRSRGLPTITVAAATTTTTATSATRRTFFPRPSLVNRKRPALKILLVKHGDGLGSILGGCHFDERKTPRSSGRSVLHDVYSDDRTCLAEVILQIVFCGGEWKVTDE